MYSITLSVTGTITRLKIVRGELSSSVELRATPADLLTILEQKRSREQQILGGGGGGGGVKPGVINDQWIDNCLDVHP